MTLTPKTDMKKTKKQQPQQRRAWTRGPRKTPGKPAIVPAKATMPSNLAEMRPRERLDAIHAMQALLDYRVRQGQLVEIAEVEAGHAEARELIRNDLIGTLPLRLAGELSGRVFDPAGVRTVVLAAVREIIRGWSKAGIPAEDGKA